MIPRTNEQLIKELMDLGYLTQPRVIEAFRAVDRKLFVPQELRANAYRNEPLPIGHNQTISQPLTVAFMLELLDLRIGDRVLDIGTGSGWQAALIAYLTHKETDEDKHPHVISIERIPELSQEAHGRLEEMKLIQNGAVELVVGDGVRGYAAHAPYDKIVAAATGDEIPQQWKDQLKIGGRIVAPVHSSLMVLDKVGRDEFAQKEFFGFAFVPLIISEK